MTRFEELSIHLKDVDPSKREIMLSLLKDFVYHEEQIAKLRAYPTYIINPKDLTKQIKLPVHDLLKDHQAQKNDIAVKILRTLDGEEGEESALMKALAKFQ